MSKANEVDTLHSAWLRLNERQHALLEESATAGTAVLDATLAGDATAAIAAERSRAAELVAIEDAIRQTRPRRIAAIRQQREAEAEKIRAEAEPLRKQAEELRANRDVLLDQLQALEGVRFDVACQREGTAHWVPVGRQRNEILDDQAAEIELRADRHAAEPIMDSNYIEGKALDELLDQLRALPADQLAPSFGEVRAAYEQCLADHQHAVVGGHYFVAGRNPVALRWDGGTVRVEALPVHEPAGGGV